MSAVFIPVCRRGGGGSGGSGGSGGGKDGGGGFGVSFRCRVLVVLKGWRVVGGCAGWGGRCVRLWQGMYGAEFVQLKLKVFYFQLFIFNTFLLHLLKSNVLFLCHFR